MKRAFKRRRWAAPRTLGRCLLFAWVLSLSQLQAASSKGTDFWLAMTSNLDSGSYQVKVFVAADVATTGNVSIPSLAFNQPFSVPGGGLTSISLPAAAMLSPGLSGPDDLIADLAIHVTASDPVSVYGLNQANAITDAYLALPVDALGNSYTVLTYRNDGSQGSTLFAITAGQANTHVTINPSAPNGVHPAGVPYTITLQQGQAYQSMSKGSVNPTADFTGTLISSDKPVSVFSGHSCVNIPSGISACDLLLEQVFPNEAWGTRYVTLPFLSRAYDVLRFLAQANNTQVQVNGVTVATLAAGAYFQMTSSAQVYIESDKPILVGQYSIGTSADGKTGDPAMLYVPPFEQYLDTYILATPPTGFGNNWVNLTVPMAAVGSVRVDGAIVPAGAFSPIGSSGFYGAQLTVTVGVHQANGPLPFGIASYGFAMANAYGYTGGLGLAKVANVAGLTLTPKTASLLVGAQHCLTATVFSSSLSPVAGIRVDFAVSGANAGGSFSYTDALGQALYCYSGASAGNDQIRASVGSLSDTAQCAWTIYTPTITPSFTVTPTLTVTRTSTLSPSFTVSVTPSITPTLTPSPTITPTFTPTPPPLTLALYPPNPNPSNNGVWLPYVIGTDAEVDVKVWTVSGEPVRAWSEGSKRLGAQEAFWDHRNEAGTKVGSGVFLYAIRARSPAGEERREFGKCAVAR